MCGGGARSAGSGVEKAPRGRGRHAAPDKDARPSFAPHTHTHTHPLPFFVAPTPTQPRRELKRSSSFSFVERARAEKRESLSLSLSLSLSRGPPSFSPPASEDCLRVPLTAEGTSGAVLLQWAASTESGRGVWARARRARGGPPTRPVVLALAVPEENARRTRTAHDRLPPAPPARPRQIPAVARPSEAPGGLILLARTAKGARQASPSARPKQEGSRAHSLAPARRTFSSPQPPSTCDGVSLWTS